MIASNYPLPAVKPEKEYPLEINVDKGTIFDGDADDNFLLYPLLDDVGAYTDMEYATTLEWAYYTEGRALKIIDIINVCAPAYRQRRVLELMVRQFRRR